LTPTDHGLSGLDPQLMLVTRCARSLLEESGLDPPLERPEVDLGRSESAIDGRILQERFARSAYEHQLRVEAGRP